MPAPATFAVWLESVTCPCSKPIGYRGAGKCRERTAPARSRSGRLPVEQLKRPCRGKQSWLQAAVDDSAYRNHCPLRVLRDRGLSVTETPPDFGTMEHFHMHAAFVVR